jgi:hypothetical protein
LRSHDEQQERNNNTEHSDHDVEAMLQEADKVIHVSQGHC